MDDAMLYYVAVPCTDEVIDLITLFSIKTGEYDITRKAIHGCGLFIYHERLEIETIDADTEWLLENKDAIQVIIGLSVPQVRDSMENLMKNA